MDPFCLEIVARLWAWPLLIEGRPIARADGLSDLFKSWDVILIRPQRIALSVDGREVEDFPLLLRMLADKPAS